MSKKFTISTMFLLLTSGMAFSMAERQLPIHNTSDSEGYVELATPMRDGKPIILPTKQNTPQKEMAITTPIYEVSGNAKFMERSAKGYFLYMNAELQTYDESGFPSILVYGEDNTVYIRDIISKASLYSYTKGHLDGNEITIDLPQSLVYNEFENYAANLVILRMEHQYDDKTGEYLGSTYVYDDSFDSVKLIINPRTGVISLSLPSSTETVYALGIVWSDTLSWAGYADESQAYYPYANGESVEIPSDVELSTYYWVTNTYGFPVYVGSDDEYIYIKGLYQESPDGAVKARYVPETGKAYLPQNQLVGTYANRVFVMTKILVYDASKDAFVLAPDDVEYELDVNLEEGVIKFTHAAGLDQSSYFIFNLSADTPMYFEAYSQFQLKTQPNFAGTPANPYDLQYSEAYLETYGYVSFYFNIPNVSNEHNILDVNDLYYRVFIDGDIVEFVSEDGMYTGLEGIVTDIPYTFRNGNDLYH